VLTYGDGERVLVPMSGAMKAGDDIEVSVRPEKIGLCQTAPTGTGDSVLTGIVTEVVYHGTSTNYTVKTSAGPDLVVFDQNAFSAEDLAGPGDRVFLTWSPQHSYPIGV
jgi:spermidine/putrescine transport system ATP-binding protein